MSATILDKNVSSFISPFTSQKHMTTDHEDTEITAIFNTKVLHNKLHY